MRYTNNGTTRKCESKNYNWIFDKETGFFSRWGETPEDDPIMAPSPEILDIEISTVCNQGCKFCYKSNTGDGTNMSLETFKQIFKTFDKNLTQIAFGIGDVKGNPELYDILRYTREQGVLPNITINGANMDDEDYEQLANLCGAIAVSRYDDDTCFNTVQRLHEAGCEQVNIHQLLSKETLHHCITLVGHIDNDERLKHLNAVVFLWLKPKGNRNTLTPLKDSELYARLVGLLLRKKIRFGFDSCSANNFLQVIKDYYPQYYERFEKYVEPCESSLFSYYINAKGEAFPCSFCEGAEGIQGIDVRHVDSFAEIWHDFSTQVFRDNLISNCRSCPVYDLEMTI